MHLTSVPWFTDWAWSLPLIVLTVLIHVFGLGLFNEHIIPVLGAVVERGHRTAMFGVVMGATVLVATILHGLEGTLWALTYRFLGALPDLRSAMLYSLGSMTTYGHADVYLENRWQLMGVLEALNGIILFGLTTAFLFGTIVRVWPVSGMVWHRDSTRS